VVRAGAAGKTVARFSQADGHYQITVPVGSYVVTAEAYGFAPDKQTKDTMQGDETSFRLRSNWDFRRLSSADVENLLPYNAETERIKASCMSCHSFATILNRRGSTAAEWKSFLPQMVRDRMFQPDFSPEQLDLLSASLEKYFGPSARYFGPNSEPPAPDKVKHADLSDKALQATVREYTVPVPGVFVHSLSVDSQDSVWFSEYDYQSNKMGRFHFSTETFEEYPIPTPRALPHNTVVGKDGRAWVSLNARGIEAKLASVDPETGKLKEYKWPEMKESGPHAFWVNKDGNLWMTSSADSEVFFFDVKKELFKGLKYVHATTIPEASAMAYTQIPGRPSTLPTARINQYDIAQDSKGIVWVSEPTLGNIVGVNPATGETKRYKAPGITYIRGITMDSQDNVWVSGFGGHKLDKFDTKSGTFKTYQPPTVNASPYGLLVDKQTGYIWFSDYNGNNITRFDPQTENFVEYPIPTHNAYPRFIGQDVKGRIWFAEWFSGKIGLVDPGDASAKQVSAATH
jgi:virginiamycin B lyase